MLRKPENITIVAKIKEGMDADVLRLLSNDPNLDQHIAFAFHLDRRLQHERHARNAVRLAHVDSEYSVSGKDSNSYKTLNNRYVQLILRWLRNDDVARLLSERSRTIQFLVGLRDSADPKLHPRLKVEAAKILNEMTKSVLHLEDEKEAKMQRALEKARDVKTIGQTREDLVEAWHRIGEEIARIDESSKRPPDGKPSQA